MSTPSASEESLALRLSDTQLDEIMRLCKPLALQCRDALLRIRTIIKDNHLLPYPQDAADYPGNGCWRDGQALVYW